MVGYWLLNGFIGFTTCYWDVLLVFTTARLIASIWFFLGSMNQSGPPTQTAHGTQLSQIFLEHFKWQGVLCWHSCSTDDIANDFRPKRFVSRDRLIKTEHSKREYRRKDQQATSC